MCRPPPKPHEDDATDDTEATHQSKRSRTKSIADQPPTPCELDRRAGNDEARVEKIAGAVSTILEALGEDRNRPGLQQTPKRLAQLLVDCTSGYARRLDEVLNGAVVLERCVMSARSRTKLAAAVLARGAGATPTLRDCTLRECGHAGLLLAPGARAQLTRGS